jgi:hypothetical protein
MDHVRIFGSFVIMKKMTNLSSHPHHIVKASEKFEKDDIDSQMLEGAEPYENYTT